MDLFLLESFGVNNLGEFMNLRKARTDKLLEFIINTLTPTEQEYKDIGDISDFESIVLFRGEAGVMLQCYNVRMFLLCSIKSIKSHMRLIEG